jgi:hypothetical protein
VPGGPYRRRGIKEKVSGHKRIGLEQDVYEYDSRLEARCAKILIRHRVAFTPHVKFECVDEDGKPFTYEVDFLFKKPEKLAGIGFIHALEVKGTLCFNDLRRIEGLELSHKIKTFIVLKPLIEMWEREGIRR